MDSTKKFNFQILVSENIVKDLSQDKRIIFLSDNDILTNTIPDTMITCQINCINYDDIKQLYVVFAYLVRNDLIKTDIIKQGKIYPENMIITSKEEELEIMMIFKFFKNK